MIVVDLSHTIISNVLQALTEPNTSLSDGLVRHQVLNALRSYKKKFRDRYGTNMVLACDGRSPWRKIVFPNYKSKRHRDRAKSKVDWAALFKYMGDVIVDLRSAFPYNIVEVEGAEADDVIAVLTNHFAPILRETGECILIVSGDDDFTQLFKHGNVDQYRPVQKDFPPRPQDVPRALHAKIIGGDSGDSIPNILSDDDTFTVKGKRQRPMRKERLAELIEQKPAEWAEELRRNYSRNEILIDLSFIPPALAKKIMATYEANREELQAHAKGARTVYEYLVRNHLRSLVEVVDEF